MTITNKEKSACETSKKCKMCEYRNRSPDSKAKNVLDLVHCDLAGPIEPEARDCFRHAAVFVDDYSGQCLYIYKERILILSLPPENFCLMLPLMGM